MREGYILTKKEASELFFLLSRASRSETGKFKTLAEQYFKKFEEALGLSTDTKDEAHN